LRSTTIRLDGRLASLITSEHLMIMSEIRQPVVLLIGDCDSPQFRRALNAGCEKSLPDRKSSDMAGECDSDVVSATLDAPQTQRATSIREAVSLLESSNLVPDLVISYQGIPDQYASADIDHLIGFLPLSRFVVAFSSWCESIGRTEQRWPLAWSVPVAHAAARIRFELQQLAVDQPPLPATTSRDEAFATLAAGRLDDAKPGGREKSATVHSADVSLRECFESIARTLGFTISSDDSTREAEFLHILVATFVDDETFSRVKELRADCAESTIIVASDMATPGETIDLHQTGANAVISQLRFAEDFVDHFHFRFAGEPEVATET
jgi:hypothetical protein